MRKWRLKVPALFLLIPIICLSLSGCWDYRDLESVSIVSGIAVDKVGEPERYKLTIEIVQGTGGNETKIEPIVVEAEGKTLAEAARNSVEISNKQLFWAHTCIAIVSEAIARDGIQPLLDWIARDAEARMLIELFVTTEKNAGDVIKAKTKSTDTHSQQTLKMIKNNKQILGKAPSTKTYEFINKLESGKSYPVLPIIKLEKQEKNEEIVLGGTAVFSGDKYIGIINENDSKYMLFATNNIKDCIIVPSNNMGSRSSHTSLEITNSNTKVTPVVRNGRLEMDMVIKAYAKIVEDGGDINFSKPQNLREYQRQVEVFIADNIGRVVTDIQKKYGVDCLNYGIEIAAEKPDEWVGIRDNWGNAFKDIKTNIWVDLTVSNSGLTSSPVKAGG